MLNENWGGFVSTFETVMRKHAPSILTGLGIAGMLMTSVLAVKATPEAMRRIEQKKQEENAAKLSLVDTVKVAAPCYISPVVTGAVSVACLVGATNVSNRRNAALSAAYSFSETALRTYREKVVETIGEKKEQDIRDKVNAAYLERSDPTTTIIVAGSGQVMFYDPISKHKFMSDVQAVRKAENTFNYNLRSDMYLSHNDFLDLLDLPRDEVVGDDIGWSVNQAEMSLGFTTVAFDGVPYMVLDYSFSPPTHGYRDY